MGTPFSEKVAKTATVLFRFKRLIKLQSICLDNATGNQNIAAFDDACNSGDTLIGLKVVVRVKWPESRGNNYIDVADYLYNWRY